MQDRPRTSPRPLTRGTRPLVGGVCSGLAEHFDLSALLVRIAFVVLSMISVGAGGLVVYAALWAIMPATPREVRSDVTRDAGESSGNAALLLGIVLVLVGVSVMFEGLHLLWWMTSAMFRFGWPALVIGAGILIIVASRRRGA